MGIVSKSGVSSGLGSLVFSSTLGADAAIIDTGATLPTTANLLVARFKARTDEAVAASTLLVRVNGSSAAVYDRMFVSGANSVAAAGNVLAATSWVISCPGNTETAGVFSTARLECFQYGGAANPKAFELYNSLPTQTALNTFVVVYGLGFRSASAINQISIAPGGGTVLRAGSALFVWTF